MTQRGWGAVLITLLLAGCGAGSSSTSSHSTPPAPAPTASTATASTPGPTSATFTFAGTAGLAGPATKPQITCNFPEIDGSTSVRVLAQPADPTALFNMKLTAHTITVVVASGSGTSYTARQFKGSGVTGFDAAHGVRVDSQLTETTPAGTKHGRLGVITSVTAAVDCGNQTTGTSTIAFAGVTADGALSGGLSPFVVTCTTSAQGNVVVLVGVLSVGSNKALAFVSIRTNSITMSESLPGPPPSAHTYSVTGPGVATLTAGTTAQINGDPVEQYTTSGTPHTLHLHGVAVCGTKASG
jgi:hypothetical protein